MTTGVLGVSTWTTDMDKAQELKNLEILKDQGLLSEKSYEAQKLALSSETIKIKPQNFLIWDSYKNYWFQNGLFTGRTNRTEFFWVTLINSFLWFFIGYSILYGFIINLDLTILKGQVGSIAVFFLLLATFILPNTAILVRRLHDVGQNGWLLAKILCTSIPLFFFKNPIIFIPAMMTTAVLTLLLVIRLMSPGHRHKNRYGSPIFFMRNTLENAWTHWCYTCLAFILFSWGFVHFSGFHSFGFITMVIGGLFFIGSTIQYHHYRKKDSETP